MNREAYKTGQFTQYTIQMRERNMLQEKVLRNNL